MISVSEMSHPITCSHLDFRGTMCAHTTNTALKIFRNIRKYLQDFENVPNKVKKTLKDYEGSCSKVCANKPYWSHKRWQVTAYFSPKYFQVRRNTLDHAVSTTFCTAGRQFAKNGLWQGAKCLPLQYAS